MMKHYVFLERLIQPVWSQHSDRFDNYYHMYLIMNILHNFYSEPKQFWNFVLNTHLIRYSSNYLFVKTCDVKTYLWYLDQVH